MGKRLANKQQKEILLIIQDFKCPICGQVLDTYQADHIIPYSCGGITNTLNLPIVMSRMSQGQNKIGQLTLRKKQKEFIDTILANGDGTYLLNLPGGYGKTDAVLAAYKLLKERGDVDRFMYILWGTIRNRNLLIAYNKNLIELNLSRYETSIC